MTKTERIAYNLVRRGAARTRAELSKVMDVSRPTASAVADALIASGLLREGGKWHSSGGRTPTLLIVRPDAFSLIGIDIDAKGLATGVLVDAEGSIVRSCEMSPSVDFASHLPNIADRIWKTLDPNFSASGIGLAVPRELAPAASVAVPASAGNDLLKLMRKSFVGKFVHMAPRLASAALSESFGGAADQEENFMLLSLDKSIEAVLHINGRCFCGSHGVAGDIRNIPAVSGDDKNATTLGEALSEKALHDGIAPERLASICASGLRHVLAVLDVGAIVLHGRFLDFDDGFIPLLERKLSCFNCNVKLAAFGRFSASRGAALETHIGV